MTLKVRLLEIRLSTTGRLGTCNKLDFLDNLCSVRGTWLFCIDFIIVMMKLHPQADVECKDNTSLTPINLFLMSVPLVNLSCRKYGSLLFVD